MKETHHLLTVHKHMLWKNGAPPEKFSFLYGHLYIEFHGLHSRIDVSGLLHFGSWHYLNFYIWYGSL